MTHTLRSTPTSGIEAGLASLHWISTHMHMQQSQDGEQVLNGEYLGWLWASFR
ncbi:Hypothetical protein FKW44_013055 [Caligus rogercresseyi]|uniref:Uncharacterized protein n=1 Tax=Caligus rogercresseyi TaxID=217165 RepID=A0A7T8HK93_CALRO|nr:Hypothetical protein FKW44_013055 [Caligus rogercresseyi]